MASPFAERHRKATAAVGYGIRSSATELDSVVAMLMASNGTPTAAPPNGADCAICINRAATTPDELRYYTLDGGTTWTQALGTGAVTVANNSGGDFAAGDLVYGASYDATNDYLEVLLADADAVGKPPQLVLTENVANGATGQAAKVCTVSGPDTSAWAEDTILYLSATATPGNPITDTAPTGAGSQQQIVGVVEVQHASTGRIRFDLMTDAPVQELASRILLAAAGAAITATEVEGALQEIFLMTRGRVYAGDAAGKLAELDASGDGHLLLGDGSDLASVAMSGHGRITSAGALSLSPADIAAAAVDVSNDELIIQDADDSNAAKTESLADLATAQAGDGLQAASGVLAVDVSDFAGAGLEDDGSENLRIAAAAAGDGLSGGAGSALAVDLNELSAAVVDVTADSIAIIDADDSNASRKESVDDLVTAMAGDGVQNTSSQFAVDVSDFAGTGLEDDGAENLRLAAQGNGIAGGAGSTLSVSPDSTTGGTVIPVDVAANGVGLDVQDIAPAVADATVDVTADEILLRDADDSNITKRESITDLVSAIAGKGVGTDSSQLAVNLAGVDAATVDVTADSIAIIDADDGNKTRKESISDLVSAMAGDGGNGGATRFLRAGAGTDYALVWCGENTEITPAVNTAIEIFVRTADPYTAAGDVALKVWAFYRIIDVS